MKKGVLKKVLMFHSKRKRDVSGITPSSVANDAVDKNQTSKFTSITRAEKGRAVKRAVRSWSSV